MSPTPPSRPTARSRIPRNANPYDAAHQHQVRAGTVTAAATGVPLTRRHVTPAVETMVDVGEEDEEEEEEDEEEDDTQEMGDADDEETAEGADGTEEIGDGDGDGDADVEGAIEEVPLEADPPFDATGLKEIGNLASWTVSTYKPGCGVEALRDDDTNLFWQSDGPQPHHLNIHFSRLVSILHIRIHLDFEVDESYTPTRITLLAGTGYHDLLPFSSLEFTQPKGWIDVPLEGVGGGRDGNTLRAFLVQVRVVENHQNGKDTHVRGLKIYARDERVGMGGGGEGLGMGGLAGRVEDGEDGVVGEKRTMMMEPEWMGEPELR